MRYTSHLDLQRTWERTFRRARLPLAFTQGFHPHPRLVFAAALPLGLTADEELMDLWLREHVSLQHLHDALSESVPAGLRLVAAEVVSPTAPSLPHDVIAAEYRVSLDRSVDLDALATRVAALLAAERLERERRGRKYDLRPLVEALELMNGGAEVAALRMRLASRPSATGRADEVLDALGLDVALCRSHRTRLVLAATGT